MKTIGVLVCLALVALTISALAQTNTFPNSGNVGIGTPAPVGTLTLSSNAASNNQFLRFENTEAGNARIWNFGLATASSGAFVLNDLSAGAERLRINSSGNIGIGTSSPSAKLHIYGTSDQIQLAVRAFTAESAGQVFSIQNSQGNAAWFNAAGNLILNNCANGGTALDTASIITTNSAQDLQIQPGGVAAIYIKSGTGNVGIGTISPTSKLEVHDGGVAITGLGAGLRIAPDSGSAGSAGVILQSLNAQTTGGSVIFMLSGVNNGSFSTAGSSLGGLDFRNMAWGQGASILSNATQTHTASTSGANLVFSTTANGASSATERLRIEQNGNVGIGTSNPTQKLSVNGTIQAKEVIVQTGWSDYVFDKDYRLAPLSEVEAHIKLEKHLPGIPSAAEVAQHGVSMGEMQAKLLAKIEELTLHQIAENKAIADLRSENSSLTARLSQLEYSHTR